MLMFTSVVVCVEDVPRAHQTGGNLQCLLSSDWLGVLIRRSKYSKYMSRNALGEAALKVVGANLNSSLLLLRISQIRISILFIYLLHLLIFFLLNLTMTTDIVPILIVKHSGYWRSHLFHSNEQCKHRITLTSPEGKLDSQFKL